MGGCWPKAFAAYNVGSSLCEWFDGKEGNDFDPRFFGGTRDKNGRLLKLETTNKWKEEVPNYLKVILRGTPEDPATGDMYVSRSHRDKDQDRARDRIYRPAVPSDTGRKP